jgi:hypothetical protein
MQKVNTSPYRPHKEHIKQLPGSAFKQQRYGSFSQISGMFGELTSLKLQPTDLMVAYEQQRSAIWNAIQALLHCTSSHTGGEKYRAHLMMKCSYKNTIRGALWKLIEDEAAM